MVFSLGIAAFYLWYRGMYTLNLESAYATTASWLLYGAELWGCFSLSLYFFQVWDVSEPAKQTVLEGKTVDVFVPTYNEDVQLLRSTLQACLDLDYDHKTYVLDDGRRDEVKALADELGVHYITRDSNQHAKAGNLNHALEQTDGEYIVIFDADHVPQTRFITRLIGYFRDDKVGMVQSPHAFYNFDNFQGSCNFEKKKYWDDGLLFYKVIQAGLNRWNSVIFAGSAAMFRRKALEEVGYIAVETITEDMHTGIRMTSKGWKTRYISEPLIAGQAAPDVTTFQSQRLRWGEGNLSILFVENPLTMPGLSFAQRISYFASIISWASGLSRLAIYLTPILLLLTGVPPLSEFTLELGVILTAYLFSIHLAMRMVSGKNWSFFDIELFAMASFWTQIRSVFRAMFRRKKSKFVVTSKRGRQTDSVTPYIAPQIAIIALSAIAVVWGLLRLAFGTSSDLFGPAIAGPLCLFYMYIAWVVVRRSLGANEQRFAYRHNAVLPVNFRFDGDAEGPIRGRGVTSDLSETGIQLVSYTPLAVGTLGRFTLSAGDRTFECRGEVRHEELVDVPLEAVEDPETPVTYRYGVHFGELTPEQTDELHRIALHFAVPKLYEHFDSRVSRTKRTFFRLTNSTSWRKREGRQPYRLPIALRASDESGLSTFTVTEDVSRSAVRIQTSQPLPEGASLNYKMSTPLGDVEGKVRVMRSEEERIGPLSMWTHVLAFTQFDRQGRGMLHSLLQPLEEKSVRDALRARGRTAPQPLFQPLAVGLLAAAVMVPSSMAVFRGVNSDDLFLQELIAEGLESEEDFQRLELVYRRALAEPTPGDRLAMLAKLMVHQGRQAEAEQMTRLMLQEEPHNMDLRKALADTLAGLGQNEEAEVEYTRIIDTLSTSTSTPSIPLEPVLLASARNLVHSGDLPTAVVRFQDYMDASHQVDQSILNEFAGVLVSAGEYARARSLLEGAPSNPDALYSLASIRAADQDFAGAETECRRALAIRPDHSGAERLLADTLAWQEDWTASTAMFEILASKYPEDEEIRRRLAEVTLWSGDLERGLVRWRDLMLIAPDNQKNWTGYLDAAGGVETLGSEDERLFRRIHERFARSAEEQSPEMAARLAGAMRRIGETAICVDLLENVVAANPKAKEPRLLLADTLHDLGEFKRADRHYSALLDKVQERSFRPPTD